MDCKPLRRFWLSKGASCSSHVAGGKVERKSAIPYIAKRSNGNIAVTIAIDPELSVKLMLSHGEFMGVVGDPQQSYTEIHVL